MIAPAEGVLIFRPGVSESPNLLPRHLHPSAYGCNTSAQNRARDFEGLKIQSMQEITRSPGGIWEAPRQNAGVLEGS